MHVLRCGEGAHGVSAYWAGPGREPSPAASAQATCREGPVPGGGCMWGGELQGVWLGHPACGTRAGLTVIGACAPTAATERPKGVDPTRVVPQGN